MQAYDSSKKLYAFYFDKEPRFLDLTQNFVYGNEMLTLDEMKEAYISNTTYYTEKCIDKCGLVHVGGEISKIEAYFAEVQNNDWEPTLASLKDLLAQDNAYHGFLSDEQDQAVHTLLDAIYDKIGELEQEHDL